MALCYLAGFVLAPSLLYDVTHKRGQVGRLVATSTKLYITARPYFLNRPSGLPPERHHERLPQVRFEVFLLRLCHRTTLRLFLFFELYFPFELVHFPTVFDFVEFVPAHDLHHFPHPFPFLLDVLAILQEAVLPRCLFCVI